VLDVHGRYRRFRAEDLGELQRRQSAAPEEMVRGTVRRAFCAQQAQIGKELGLSQEAVAAAASALEAQGELLRLGDLWLDAEELDRRLDRAERSMRECIAQDPLWRGWERSTWRREVVPELEARAASAIQRELADAGRLRLEGDRVLPEGDRPALPEDLRRDLDELALFLEAGGLQPESPDLWPKAEQFGPSRLEDMLVYLQGEGRLVRAGDIWFGRQAVDSARGVLRHSLSDGREATTAALREALGTTRKFAVPLLEYFDQQLVTRRFGDVRRLLEAAKG
jgi:selenocysteine-specific elongation factor